MLTMVIVESYFSPGGVCCKGYADSGVVCAGYINVEKQTNTN